MRSEALERSQWHEEMGLSRSINSAFLQLSQKTREKEMP